MFDLWGVVGVTICSTLGKLCGEPLSPSGVVGVVLCLLPIVLPILLRLRITYYSYLFILEFSVFRPIVYTIAGNEKKKDYAWSIVLYLIPLLPILSTLYVFILVAKRCHVCKGM